jgi:hypothetical protein
MTDTVQQLTFNVGGETPDKSLLRLSGAVFTHRELTKGEEIHLQVVDADGAIVADGYGRVLSVQFKDQYDKDGNVEATERVHGAKVS